MPTTSRARKASRATRARSRPAPKTGARRRTAASAPCAGLALGGISDGAVEKATGKAWAHWVKVLDGFDVKAHGHAAAAEFLGEALGVKPWWCQMVVVGYEQHRGRRAKHQVAGGYQVGASRVIAAPVREVWRAVEDARVRARWLPDPAYTVRKATPFTSVRITWVDGTTSVELMFYPKRGKDGVERTQLAVQHGKFPSAAKAAKMKKYWGAALDSLRAMLEGTA